MIAVLSVRVLYTLLTSCAGTTCHARRQLFVSQIATFPQFQLYLNVTQAKQMMRWFIILLNHFYPAMSHRRVQKKKKATNYCIRPLVTVREPVKHHAPSVANQSYRIDRNFFNPLPLDFCPFSRKRLILNLANSSDFLFFFYNLLIITTNVSEQTLRIRRKKKRRIFRRRNFCKQSRVNWHSVICINYNSYKI